MVKWYFRSLAEFLGVIYSVALSEVLRIILLFTITWDEPFVKLVCHRGASLNVTNRIVHGLSFDDILWIIILRKL